MSLSIRTRGSFYDSTGHINHVLFFVRPLSENIRWSFWGGNKSIGLTRNGLQNVYTTSLFLSRAGKVPSYGRGVVCWSAKMCYWISRVYIWMERRLFISWES